MELPDIITVTITEEARQTAERFSKRCNCILATQLKLDGYQGVTESLVETFVDKARYKHEYFGTDASYTDYCTDENPSIPRKLSAP